MEKIGGQAVINGVMMKAPGKMAIAVRKGKKIIIKEEKLNLLAERIKKVVIIRGVVGLFETLSLGIKALNYSAEIAEGKKLKENKKNSFVAAIIMIISVLFGILLFKFLPLLTAQLINPSSYIMFNVIDGVVKIIIFVAYVYAISLMKDVRTVFQYHGAEHKAVNCYEAGKKLTVKNVQSFSTINLRCGTSLVFIVLLLSIAVYIFIPKDLHFMEKLIYRLLLLPFIAGLSYELMKLSARFEHNIFFRTVSFPGKLIQKITTKEPNNRQAEVAIAALKRVILSK